MLDMRTLESQEQPADGEAGICAVQSRPEVHGDVGHSRLPEMAIQFAGDEGRPPRMADEKETVVRLVIRHRKPLPASIEFTDLIAQRAYGWLFSQGVEVDVTASFMERGAE